MCHSFRLSFVPSLPSPPISQSFSSLRFLSRYTHGFSLSLSPSLSSFIGSKLKSKLAEDRGHYRVSIVRRSVSKLLPRSLPTSLFSPFFLSIFLRAGAKHLESVESFYPSQENGLFSSRYLESNRRTDERGILKKLVRKEYRKKSRGGKTGKFKIAILAPPTYDKSLKNRSIEISIPPSLLQEQERFVDDGGDRRGREQRWRWRWIGKMATRAFGRWVEELSGGMRPAEDE